MAASAPAPAPAPPHAIEGSSPIVDDKAANVIASYEIPEPEPFVSFNALKDRIRHHYELASDYYYSLWGEHIHHGYFLTASDTKERAQVQLVELLLERSGLPRGSSVLDVGCGIGGTSRHLAKEHGCHVVGVTISGRQVEIACRLTSEASGTQPDTAGAGSATKLGDGSVKFIELDAEKMGAFFTTEPNVGTFDCVWISEAMSHLPNKELFFRNAALLLREGGQLVVADWFKREDLTEQQFQDDIAPIEDGMLLPPLCSQAEYVRLANSAGLKTTAAPFDISKQVSKTWDISWSLIQNPALWAFAVAQGRDGLAFMQAFHAMRRGFATGTFRYAVMAFQK
ncbi:methyltransferase domain-containing protein [Drepanopeziza brunnea f. sp. 'multigermtubi' MB_m1]|uniref:Methyltransferase domain-containing protein n=1 Tax=Marssonina brunnea f. sp. multigermtubi (strain MB_m1) TaxID=1072389 RepID=K1XGM1_MARBU|nr:methyltransferase domain-containing protein [Drepanopeziza brunnea f. sp. 'multigermtubi' MB_m1]EKD19943.1 methyltransferase domain-containing protein [Drepanopeziza brunnea f. sp. 'multigermtubi' MB_m1]